MLLCTHYLCAQQYDNVWLLGYESSSDTSIFGGTVLEFNTDSVNIFYQFRDMNFEITNTSLCDSLGNLLFYTNGIYVADSSHNPMENGEGLNPGEYADDHQNYGYILDQGVLAIPKPGSQHLYYLFHASLDYPNSEFDWHSPFFYYSVIDMSLNSGLGAVVEKNIVVIDDILSTGKITATRHANGVDWWILMRKYDSNKYYRILITSNGVTDYGIQEVGEVFNNGIGQAFFSPDGSKYIIYNAKFIDEGNLLNIYDFDRCSGLLSNPIHAIVIDSAYALGGAVSPNSKYLYLSSYNYVYQFDLEANDILSTKDTVAIYDGYEVEIAPGFGIPTRFNLMQLAPDGKIYINVPGGVNLMHVINNPDEGGEDCEVLQHSVTLPTYNARSIPNYPNYRLGELLDSPCDSLVNNLSIIEKSEVKIHPNPVSLSLFIEFEYNALDKVCLFSAIGEKVYEEVLVRPEGHLEIDVSKLPSGIYYCTLLNKVGQVRSERVVIVH